MMLYNLSVWGVLVGLALMLVGGFVLWTYGAHTDRRVAEGLGLDGLDAEMTRRFHTSLVRWFRPYGFAAIGGGLVVLLVSSMTF